MTLNRELFHEDPLTYVIPNAGVSKVARPRDPEQWDVLRYELRSFVADGEYAQGLERVLDSYLRHHGQGTQPAAWVSGFYGSGKSHLVRVLEHLWADTAFSDGAGARGLVTVPEAVRGQLTELTTVARRSGTRPWSAAGNLETGDVDDLNRAFLAVVLRAAGLPEKLAPARLALWLRSEGLYDGVREQLVAAGRDPLREIATFHLSEALASAVLAQRPTLAATTTELRAFFKAQFPDRSVLTGNETMGLLREVLEGVGGGQVPPTLLVLDEVQQYINDDGARSLAVQDLVEAVSAQFAGRVLVVATGQSELAATDTLKKLQDRFRVGVHLRNTDVDVVVRQVVLRKDPVHAGALHAALEREAGEISRHLSGSRLSHRAADEGDLVADYPVLPSRRRLWEEVLRAADHGRTGQLRSQLRIIHEANRSVAERPLGTVVGADFLYGQKVDDLQAGRVLLKETQLLIEQQRRREGDGVLRGRVLAMIVLIGLLPTTGARDTGVRATQQHIADLLVEDLTTDGADLRRRVPEVLEALVTEGVIQRDGHEHRLQTAEGREWDNDLSRTRAGLRDDTAAVATARDAALRAAVDPLLPRGVPQGATKARRTVRAHHGSEAPETSDVIPVWVRSEWDVTAKAFRDSARGAGQASPVVFVHLPKRDPEGFTAAVVDLAAIVRVLESHMPSTTDEGTQAGLAMQSRRAQAERRVIEAAGRIVDAAEVELAGGARGDGSTMATQVEQVVKQAVTRLYPGHHLVDHAGWRKVAERLHEGAGTDALTSVDHRGAVEDHPATKALLGLIPAAWTSAGTLEKLVVAPPYGWDRDALRGVLAALVAAGVVTAQVNGSPADARVVAGSTKIGTISVRRESEVVSPGTVMEARGLLQQLGVTASTSELAVGTRTAITSLKERAAAVSGMPPMPVVSLPPTVAAVLDSSGNAQVLALVAVKDDLLGFGARVGELESRLPSRSTGLATARTLAEHARRGGVAQGAVARLGVVLTGRGLLDEVDPLAPVLDDLVSVLRGRLIDDHAGYEAERRRVVVGLESDPVFAALGEDERAQALTDAGLVGSDPPRVTDAREVVTALTARSLDAAGDRVDALAARAGRLLTGLTPAAAPRATAVRLPRATLSSAEDVDAYLADLRTRLVTALDGYDAVTVGQL